MAAKIDREDERWQVSRNPHTLFKILLQRGVEGNRRYRLAAATCCRLDRTELGADQRRAIGVIERYADGEAKYNEMRLAVSGMRLNRRAVQPLVVEAARRDAQSCLSSVMFFLLECLWHGRPDDLVESFPSTSYGKDRWDRFCDVVCHIIRDIFANEFAPVLIHPAWRTATVLDLATAAYRQRDPATGTLEPIRLAVLADALQDAGCDSHTLLDHFREPGPHALGCWAVDLVLGKPA